MSASEILVINDSHFELMQMENYLSDLDECQSVFIGGSKQALSWCQENNPDLVLVDYQMPELDGLGFIEQFRKIAGRDNRVR